MKLRKSITVTLLIISALSIWGYNAWQVIEVVGPKSSEINTQQNSNSIQPLQLPTPSVPLVYSATSRDPFSSHLSHSVESQVESQFVHEEVIIELPSITYKGMIGNTAVVLDQFGDQYFLKRNHLMGEITLIRIEIEQIRVEYRGQLFDVNLN